MDEIEYVKKLIEIGDVEGAIKELNALIKDHPKNIKAWFLLADIEEDEEKKKECYRQILRYDLNNKNAQDELTKLVDASQKENLSTRVEIQQENSDKKTSEGFKFQPRYITAVAGLGVMIGALSTWVVSYHGKVKSIEYGFKIPIGIFTLMMGLAIILISVMHKTSPQERSALIASIISFALFVILALWSNYISFSSSECIHNDVLIEYGTKPYIHPDCIKIYTGSGFFLSQLSLILAFFSGLIRNPKGNESN